MTTPTCKIKVSKISKPFQKKNNFVFNFFLKIFWSIDRRRRQKQCRDDENVEKTQQMEWKRSKTIQKRLENRSKTFRKLYVFGWAHCFGLFWNFPIQRKFDTLILHLSVVWLYQANLATYQASHARDSMTVRRNDAAAAVVATVDSEACAYSCT